MTNEQAIYKTCVKKLSVRFSSSRCDRHAGHRLSFLKGTSRESICASDVCLSV